MANRAFSVGVDIGGTSIKFGIVDALGKIHLHKAIETLPERGSDVIVAAIGRQIQSLLNESSLRSRDLAGIGVGVPGTADSAHGTVVYAPNLFWRNVEIVAALQPGFDAPIHIAQDTRAAAWAEYLVGTGLGQRGLAAVTLGTGIGCGMVIDGKIFHGALNTAGEFGHQIVEIDGEPCNCGRHGCLEAHAGGLAIVREAKKRIPDLALLLGKDQSEIAVADVYRLASQGNAQARRITDDVVRYIGIGLVNLIDLNSLETICLSGGICNAPPELLLDPLIAFVRQRAYEAVADKVRLFRSRLGENAPLIGAALLHRACGDGAAGKTESAAK